jgi:hypothetical protein
MPYGVFDSLRSLGEAILVAALLASGGDPSSAAASPRVRSMSEPVRMLIAETMRRSAVVRELVARLACSDVIVYVEITASPLVPTARTKLVATAGEMRFLRIGLNAGIADSDQGALLAHELQHAVEIAEHEDVRDEAALRRLYARIGHEHHPDAYETDAAQEVELQARRELRRRIGG